MNRAYLLSKIGAPPPAKKLIVEDQVAIDIMRQILRKHRECAKYYDRIAEDFEARDIYDVAEALFNFCKKHLEYREETVNIQNVSSPQTILKRAHCDCKGYALFIGGILDALNRRGWNIKFKYRFASDSLFDSTPGHVFIVINDNGQEIWVDPVLKTFNQDHFFPSYQDKKVGAPAVMAGCDCDQVAMGATGQETGIIISKISPALAVIPVVGWIAAGAGSVLGFFLQVFGSKYEESTNVRWLTQIFEQKVLGLDTKSDNNVQQGNIALAQKWFSTVLGVPIYDQYRYWSLRGQDFNHLDQPRKPREQRVIDYLSYPDVKQAGITYDQALQATYIADTMDPLAGKKAWAGATAAPSLIDKSGNVLHVDASGQLVTASGTTANAATLPATNSKMILIVAAAAIAFILIKK